MIEILKKSIIVISLLLTNSIVFAQSLTQEQALEDVVVFEDLLRQHSSYLDKSGFDYHGQILELKDLIKKHPKISVELLQLEMSKIVGRIGDRHSKVKIEGRYKDGYPYKLLPFFVAPFKEKVIALISKENSYEVLYPNFPYLTSINNIPIDTILEASSPRAIMAPEYAKLYRQVKWLRYFEEVLALYMNIKIDDEVAFQFSNNDATIDTVVYIQKSSKRSSWTDIGDIAKNYENAMDDGDYDTLFQWKDNIAYMIIPSMISKKKFQKVLKEQMNNYRNSDALIIDIRGNGGGSRDILQTLAPYLVSNEQQPWVANVTYVRTDNSNFNGGSSMNGRYLYNYESNKFSNKDRQSIDEFNKSFKTKWEFDESNFSQAFYMVLPLRTEKDYYFYNKPIYILSNELCFSAASVFASAFKGLPNVKLVGRTTDGSSGRSKYFTLPNSKIKVKLSTMISFQRNGLTLDGNGTKPDIEIEPDMNYILNKNDNQLEKLIEIINTENSNN